MAYNNTDLHNKIYSDLSNKMGIDKEVVEKICRSIWEFGAKVMEEGKDEPYHLKYLGDFLVKPGRRKFWNEYEKKKQEEISDRHSDITREHDSGDGRLDIEKQEDIVL